MFNGFKRAKLLFIILQLSLEQICEWKQFGYKSTDKDFKKN